MSTGNIAQIFDKFLDKLEGQPISVFILALIAYFLWIKQSDLEDRFTRYMNEDRQRMNEVINDNSRAMDRNSAIINRNTLVLDKFLEK